VGDFSLPLLVHFSLPVTKGHGEGIGVRPVKGSVSKDQHAAPGELGHQAGKSRYPVLKSHREPQTEKTQIFFHALSLLNFILLVKLSQRLIDVLSAVSAGSQADILQRTVQQNPPFADKKYTAG